MNEILNYISDNKDNFLKELIEFLKIPSISSISTYKEYMIQAAKWLSENMKSAGLKNVRIIPTAGHSIVYGEWLEAGPKAPTVLVYGHYDVQPVDPLNLWEFPPFDPVIKNGKIYARGSADDKGQLFIHIKAVESFLKTVGKLPVNIKFLIEGEEEAGSNHLDEFIENNREMLLCDTVLISDTEWFAEGKPSICYSLRGIAFVELTVTGPNRDLHSGTYGGGIDNPLNVLCWMVSKLKDDYGRITIPGFYDDVRSLTSEERANFKKLPFDEVEYCKDLDIPMVNGEIGFTTLERVSARPTLDLNGIYGGYTGEGAKTIIPSKAIAKISMRLVPDQKPDDIINKIEKHLKNLAPPTVKIEIKKLHGGNPVLVPLESKGIKSAVKAFQTAFGKEVLFTREGGSIPIVSTFLEVLNAPSVLMGMGLPGDNIHSPNENFNIENFFGGIKVSALFLDEFSK